MSDMKPSVDIEYFSGNELIFCKEEGCLCNMIGKADRS